MPREINRVEPIVDAKGRATQFMQSMMLDINQRLDSVEYALIYFRNNATNTVINTANTPVQVAGTWLNGGCSKFSMTAAGVVTSLSERPFTAPIDIFVTARMASAGNCDCTFYIAKNGTIIAETGTKDEISSSVSKSVSIPWQLTFNLGDQYSVWAENNSTPVDVLVEQATLRIR